MQRTALAVLSTLVLSPAAAGAQDRLIPGSLTYEHILEHRWSDGRLWSLLPRPGAALQLHIRIGENYQVRAVRAAGKYVHVLWLPHAAGTDTGSEIVARLATDRGWAVTSLLPPGDLPRPGAPVEEWVGLVEERVRSARAALRVGAENTENSHQCVALIGVSVGGIASLRVAELEGSVDVVVGMLAGTGAEGLLHAARAYGAAPSQLSAEMLARVDALDPAKNAEGLRGRPVLLVRALFDDVIPPESFDALRGALEDPEVHSWPTGHESFVYVMPWAVDQALDWVDRACAVSGSD